MTGIFFGEETQAGGPVDGLTARPRNLAEEIAAGFEAHRRVTNFNKVDLLMREETRKRLDRIEVATGVRPRDPFKDQFDEVDEKAIFDRWMRVDARAGATIANQQIAREKRAALEAHIDALREKFPEKDFDGGRDAFEAQVRARAQELEAQLGEIGLPANIISGVGASFTDPTNIAANLVGGGGKTLLGAVVREAAANAGVELLLTPIDQAQRRTLGLETSTAQVAGNVAGAAVFGGVFGAGGKGVEWAWGKLTKRQALDYADSLPDEVKTPEVVEARDALEQEIVVDEALAPDADMETAALHAAAIEEIERELGFGRPVDELPGEPGIADAVRPAPTNALVDIDGQTVQAYDAGHAELLRIATRRANGEPASTADLLPLFRGLVVDEDDRLINSVADLDAFADDWLALIRDGEIDAEWPMLESGEARAQYLERISRYREAEAVPPAAAPVVAPSADSGFRGFDPDEIIVDAKRFQFKSGGDEAGVTDALRGVRKWDPLKAGTIIVWEDVDGRVYVADGHQRVGLARRLKAEGQAPVLQGHVLRAADGVSAEDARAIAAGVNIARGTGTAVDAAKVLKVRPDLLDGALNPRAAFVRQAQGLMRLGDDAFGMVINEVVREDFGALVGEIVRDPAEQVAVMGILARQSPGSALEAEALIRQARAAGFVEATQETLFGADVAAESMLAYRADVLARAVSQLRKDKRIFSTLDREADEISQAGNVLDKDANREIAQNAAEIAETVLKTAHLAGPVSDALGRAARRLADTGKPGPAVKQFVDELRALGPAALRGLPQNGRGLRGEVGGGGAAGARGPAAPEASGLDALDDFDEPRKGAEIQNDDLTDDLFGGPIENYVEREKDAEARQSVVDAEKKKALAKSEPAADAEPKSPQVIRMEYVARHAETYADPIQTVRLAIEKFDAVEADLQKLRQEILEVENFLAKKYKVQRSKLYELDGIATPDEEKFLFHSALEVADVDARLRTLEQVFTQRELEIELGYAINKLPDAADLLEPKETERLAIARIMALSNDAFINSFDFGAALKRAVELHANRFNDPVDAEFMVDNLMQTLRAMAAADTAPKASLPKPSRIDPDLDPDEPLLAGLDEDGAPIIRKRSDLEKEFEADADMVERLKGCVKQ